jgi:hypothetical protein
MIRAPEGRRSGTRPPPGPPGRHGESRSCVNRKAGKCRSRVFQTSFHSPKCRCSNRSRPGSAPNLQAACADAAHGAVLAQAGRRRRRRNPVGQTCRNRRVAADRRGSTDVETAGMACRPPLDPRAPTRCQRIADDARLAANVIRSDESQRARSHSARRQQPDARDRRRFVRVLPEQSAAARGRSGAANHRRGVPWRALWGL